MKTLEAGNPSVIQPLGVAVQDVAIRTGRICRTAAQDLLAMMPGAMGMPNSFRAVVSDLLPVIEERKILR